MRLELGYLKQTHYKHPSVDLHKHLLVRKGNSRNVHCLQTSLLCAQYTDIFTEYIRGEAGTNNWGRLLTDKISTQHHALGKFDLDRKQHPIWRFPYRNEKSI